MPVPNGVRSTNNVVPFRPSTQPSSKSPALGALTVMDLNKKSIGCCFFSAAVSDGIAAENNMVCLFICTYQYKPIEDLRKSCAGRFFARPQPVNAFYPVSLCANIKQW